VKNIARLVIAGGLLVSSAAFSGLTTAHPAHAATTLTVWLDVNNASYMTQLKQLVHTWEGKRNIDVQFVDLAEPGRGGTSIDKAFPLKAKSSEGPDMVYVPEDQTGVYSNGHLLDKAPKNLFSKAQFAKYAPGMVNAFKVNGTQYGVPYALDGTLLFYNKALVKKAPTTWAQLISTAKKLTHGDQYGMIFPIANLYFSSFAFNGYGAPAFPKKNGKYNWHTIGFNSANGVKALTFLGNLAKQNVVPKDADYGPMDSNFTAGKVGFAINGPWAFPAWSKALGSKMGVANIPILPNGKASKPYVGIRGWEVNAFSQNKALSWSLAKYLSLNGQSIMADNEGRLPVLKKAPHLTLTSLQRAAIKQYHVGVPMPNIPEFGTVWDPMGAALTNVVQGRATPKVALNTAAQQITAKIADMHQ